MTHIDSAPTRKRNKNKERGTAAETDVVRFLNEAGFPSAERRALRGINDCGDITGIPLTAIEVKDCSKIDLAKFVGEANVERVNAGAEWGAAWIKRRGKGSPGDWYVAMDGRNYIRLLRAALGIEDDEQIPGQLSLLDEGAA